MFNDMEMSGLLILSSTPVDFLMNSVFVGLTDLMSYILYNIILPTKQLSSKTDAQKPLRTEL